MEGLYENQTNILIIRHAFYIIFLTTNTHVIYNKFFVDAMNNWTVQEPIDSRNSSVV